MDDAFNADVEWRDESDEAWHAYKPPNGATAQRSAAAGVSRKRGAIRSYLR